MARFRRNLSALLQTRFETTSGKVFCPRTKVGHFTKVLQLPASSTSLLYKSSPVGLQAFAFQQFSTNSENGDQSDSHDDFKPQVLRKDTNNDDAARDDVLKLIEEHVKAYPILLYMKGTPQRPQCGFSAQVVRILHAQGVDFDSVNVLAHEEIRDGIKQYSNWPTVPQLYVNGDFVGGCDIVTDMHKSGDLEELLKDLRSQKTK